MQPVLDTYLDGYNQRRPHQGRGMAGRTPANAFREGVPTVETTLAAPAPKPSSPKKKEKPPVEKNTSSIAI
jgi:hypothetical protein